ncbi:membrane protein [Myceligenerans cantabricum]
MSTTTASPAVVTATSLRNLYLVRFGFAVVWAVAMFVVGASLGPATVTLLVLYPLFDVAAAVVDLRSSKAARPAVGLYVNIALSLLTTIGLAVAVTSGIPAVLRVWGAWAITAGIVQLVVATGRYRLGGQWAMILSGGISVLAGSSFIAMAGGPGAALASVAGYATLGGIFFAASALRLHSVAKKGS